MGSDDSHVHDPNAVLDYPWDWAQWLKDTETITSYTIDVDGTVAINSTVEGGGLITVWISGGVHGDISKVTCHVVTSEGRQDDRTKTLEVLER